MTRGGLWEVVAVPDIRVQSWDLARRLSNARLKRELRLRLRYPTVREALRPPAEAT